MPGEQFLKLTNVPVLLDTLVLHSLSFRQLLGQLRLQVANLTLFLDHLLLRLLLLGKRIRGLLLQLLDQALLLYQLFLHQLPLSKLLCKLALQLCNLGFLGGYLGKGFALLPPHLPDLSLHLLDLLFTILPFRFLTTQALPVVAKLAFALCGKTFGLASTTLLIMESLLQLGEMITVRCDSERGQVVGLLAF